MNSTTTTQDKYHEIKQRLLLIAEKHAEIKAVVAIGSSTRSDVPADEYSDLDLIIATDDTDSWLYGNLPAELGDVKISFVEPTLGGGMERRILYCGWLDVDMIVFTAGQFLNAVNDGTASWVMNRGYAVLHDRIGAAELLKQKINLEIHKSDFSESEFQNLASNFYFHTVWAAKKLLRGELWSAKMCLDSYLKNLLLKVLEVQTATKNHADVWHDGRFLDRWADEEIRVELKNCFARYDKDDMKNALKSTHRLFARTAKETAALKNFAYPDEAKKFSEEFLEEKL
ncbi:aminoglycoside 6-adenylyltransferase [Treponema sp. UBA753]|uniref:aminoglycoside 6-adenylyltransferase n=1 Tax=Treponema sp. UBA753 TaxID=1947747 RepID=UPI0025EDF4FF|nr:aminoglycoside 6-adenylyltransferase [Treponema sp. UBA753]